MAEYKHWCGNCQIRVYVSRHYGRWLTWQDCPYTCEYAIAMRNSTQHNDSNALDALGKEDNT